MSSQDCESIFAALSSYVDGELPPADCEALERHIQGGAPCVKFVKSLRKTIRLARQFQPDEPIPSMPPEIKRELEKAYADMLKRRTPEGA